VDMDITEISAAIAENNAATREAIVDLTARIDQIEARDNRRRLTGGGNPSGNGDLVAECRALGAFIVAGDDTEFMALSVGSDPGGGYVTHSQLSAEITKRIYDASPMRRLAR